MSVAVCPCSLVAKEKLSTSLQQQNIKFWYTLLLVFTIIKMGKNLFAKPYPMSVSEHTSHYDSVTDICH